MKLSQVLWFPALLAGPAAAQCELDVLDGSHLPVTSQFGFGLATDGDTTLVGDWFWEDDGTGTGWVSVYRRAGATWELDDVLSPGDGDEAFSTMYGDAVAVAGDRAIVGAPGRDLTELAGRVFFYSRSAGSWSSDGVALASNTYDGDGFGSAVALDGARAVVANGPGELFAFERAAGAWVETQAFSSPTSSFEPALALDGDTLLVGDPGESSAGFATGAAHVFEHDGAAWVFADTLHADDAHGGMSFGGAVAVDGDRALIGAENDDHAGFASGAAYVFERSGGAWSQQDKLAAADAASADHFGNSVSLADGVALVGAYLNDDLGAGSGSAYTFEEDESGWQETAALTGSTTGTDSGLGWRVATCGTFGFATAPFLGPGPGEVVVFGVGGPDCNRNRAFDVCDIGGGVSTDFDAEGTPDECQPLAVDTPALSVSAGGTQTFTLDAGNAWVGKFYVLLGSLSGTEPGLDLGAVHLPLNFDEYTLWMLLHANEPPLGDTAGPLGAGGVASAAIELPPGSNPALVGLALDHAYVVLLAGEAGFASNAVPLDLLP